MPAKSKLFGPPQLDLFGGRLAKDPHAALRSLGDRLPSRLRLGTSSWTFTGWADIVYFDRYANQKAFLKDSLGEYARHPLLRTVGIDRSYYAPMTAKDLGHYKSLLPQDFVAVSKVWSEITTRIFPRHHARAGQVNERFLDPSLFEAFVEPYKAFEPHTGPFVVEVPPAPGPVNADGFADAVARFLDAHGDSHRFAFELRDKRLFSERYVKVLRSRGASHVYNWWSHMPSIETQLDWTGGLVSPFVVSRLLLPPGRSYVDMKEAYQPFDHIVVPQPSMREQVLRLIRAAMEASSEVLILVNNKAEGSSPLTIEALARLLAE